MRCIPLCTPTPKKTLKHPHFARQKNHFWGTQKRSAGRPLFLYCRQDFYWFFTMWSTKEHHLAAAKSELHLYAKTRFPALFGRATNCPRDGLAQTLSRVADLMLVRLSMSDTSCLPPHFTAPAFVVLVELVEHNYTSLDPKQQAPLMLAGSNPKLA